MIAEMLKLQIAAPSSQEDELLQFLQEEEVLHIAATDVAASRQSRETTTAYRLAQVQFALEFVQRIRTELHEEKKKGLKNLFAGKPAASMEELEAVMKRLSLDEILKEIRRSSDTLANLAGEQHELEERKKALAPWRSLAMRGSDRKTNQPIIHRLIQLSTTDESDIIRQVAEIPTAEWQVIHRELVGKSTTLYGELIAHEKDEQLVRSFLDATRAFGIDIELKDDESVADQLERITSRLAQIKREQHETLTQSKQFLEQEQDLQFAYDALLHLQEREAIEEAIGHLPYTTVVTGWLPKSFLPAFIKRTERTFPNVAVEEVAPEKDEKPPVALMNKPAVRPFEAVTNIYGKPAYTELDPSGALALFFLISFGLALTDAGYGLVMMAVMWSAEKFFRLKREMRKMVRLLFYAGAATTVMGAVTGGWFGVTLENLPASGLKDALLSMKLIDPISNPIGLLLVTFAVGITQLLFAWVVRGYHSWNTGNKASVFLDDIPWIGIVVSILLWVAAAQGILPASLATPFKYAIWAFAVYLVFTQGRVHKNPALKLGSGILSLYGLVSFLSDTLSYSRLLALGLATAIIGLVVNLIASMVSGVPVVGLVLAGVVLLVGHVFNLGINALGAFIHSGRLQFVEFFPKFMEGGGQAYKPLGRVSRYVDNPKEFVS